MRWKIIMMLLALLLLGSGGVTARETLQGDQCIVTASEVIESNLFITCRTLVLNGRVEGNLIGAATDARIDGEVTGDVYLIAGQLDIGGTIGGNLHFGGAVLRILPTAVFNDEHADLMSLSLSTTLTDGAILPGGITDVGYQLVLDGETGGEVNFWGSALTVNGAVGRDVDANVGDPESGISQLQTLLIPFSWDVNLIDPGIVITQDGLVAGDLRYSGPVAGRIEGRVTGETVFTEVNLQPDLTQIITEEQGARRGLSLYLSQVVREFITLGIISLLGLLLLPRPFQLPLRHIQSRPLPSLGVGLLTFILSFPIILILLLLCLLIVFILSLLGLDSLLLVGGGLLGIMSLTGVSLFYFVAIFISRAIVALWLGRLLVRTTLGDDGSMRIIYISLAVGLALIALLTPLPVIGWAVSAVGVFLGLGAIVIGLQSQFRTYRDIGPVSPLRVSAPAIARRPDAPLRMPPLLNDRSHQPGMDNLPEGFSWWEDD